MNTGFVTKTELTIFYDSKVLLEGGDGQQQSVAVRLALGETQLVAETKQFLVENGIHLDAFQDVKSQHSFWLIRCMFD